MDIEYQNADLWGLWGGCERTPCTPPGYGPGAATCTLSGGRGYVKSQTVLSSNAYVSRIEKEAMSLSEFYCCICDFPCCCHIFNSCSFHLPLFHLSSVAVSRLRRLSEFYPNGPSLVFPKVKKLTPWALIRKK